MTTLYSPLNRHRSFGYKRPEEGCQQSKTMPQWGRSELGTTGSLSFMQIGLLASSHATPQRSPFWRLSQRTHPVRARSRQRVLARDIRPRKHTRGTCWFLTIPDIWSASVGGPRDLQSHAFDRRPTPSIQLRGKAHIRSMSEGLNGLHFFGTAWLP